MTTSDQTPRRLARLLIVDDEEQNRMVLRDPLEARGYAIEEAQDGAEALRKVSECPPDVILLDVMMPLMNGFEACRRLKRDARTASIPVVMVTALSDRKERLMGIEAGADDFLTKPVDLQEVALRVANAARGKQLFDELQVERAKSEELLLNILPASIARRMKAGETNLADSHAEVSVLCAAIAGADTLFSHIAPESVVALLNEIFSEFDALTEQQGLEKIKTVGGLYMVVAGMAQSRSDHAEALADLAFQLGESLAFFNRRNGTALRMGIGVSTGPVVAGVIGRKRFAYDLWGETVNTAARMATLAPPGAVQIAPATRERLQARYHLREIPADRKDARCGPQACELGGRLDASAPFHQPALCA